MKKIIFVMLIMAMPLFAQDADPIIHHYAARNFLEGTIPRTKLDAVLAAGINAPSAMNKQPWHFTVIQDEKLAKQIVSDTKKGNVLIIVSAALNGNEARVVLDCGLAVESLYLAAQALGLGSRIYSGPMNIVNGKFKSELPKGHTAVALVRVGLVEQIDALSAASSRKAAADKVTYK